MNFRCHTKKCFRFLGHFHDFKHQKLVVLVVYFCNLNG